MTPWFKILIDTAPPLITLALGAALCVLLFRYFSEPVFPGMPLGEIIRRIRHPAFDKDGVEGGTSLATRRVRRSLRRNALAIHHQARIALFVALMFGLSRLIIVATAVVGCAFKGELGQMLAGMPDYWVRWDAPHYIGLADNWYVSEGDPRFHIVFFPFFPLIVRMVKPLFFGNTHLAASIISNLCLLGAGFILYHLLYEQQGERAARRGVRFLMFSPLAVFFSVPYSESLFLMLTLLAVILARRRSFSLAVAVGALAANTRSLGVLVAVPIYLEMLKHVRSLELWPARKRRHIALIGGYTLMVSLVASGFVAYLLINWRVTGNPFQFLIHQREHWGQSLGTVANTVRYTLEQAATVGDGFWRLGVWVPQAIIIPLSVALMVGTAHRIYPGDGAYGWLYLVLAISPTWLLSGPRYVAALYALYPMLTLITRKPWQDAAMMVASTGLMALASYMYVVIGNLL